MNEDLEHEDEMDEEGAEEGGRRERPAADPGPHKMKELIEQMARQLVDTPDKVVVREVAGDRTVIYELQVADTDLGKVIGKNGRTARAMRTILQAASVKADKRAVLEIIE